MHNFLRKIYQLFSKEKKNYLPLFYMQNHFCLLPNTLMIFVFKTKKTSVLREC